MAKPEQRVIVYQGGVSGDKYTRRRNHQRRYLENKRAESGDCTPCPRCGRVLKKPEHSHYSDLTNKTPCIDPKEFE